MKPEEQMLISAVRYAIGRSSYIVSDTCRFVTNIKSKLSNECIDIMIHDIEFDLELYHRAGNLCGMECDEKEWSELLNVLKLDVMEAQHETD